jgi:hypothetical protein
MTRTEQRRETEAVQLAEWMIDNDSTIKQLQEEFLMSRSTIFRRLTVTLKYMDYDKYQQCQHILDKHAKLSLERARRTRWGKSLK